MPAAFYATANGDEPVREWLMSMSAANRKSIGDDIRTVQYGWPLGMPLVRKLERDLWEVRSDIKDGIARVVFTVWKREIVLLHGFEKKSQATPAKDLELARKRKNEVRNG